MSLAGQKTFLWGSLQHWMLLSHRSWGCFAGTFLVLWLLMGVLVWLCLVAWRHEARTVLTPVLEVESSFCCSLIASLCLTAFLADSKVSFGSNWSFSDRLVSPIPTTSLSQIISDFILPYLQSSASVCHDILLCWLTGCLILLVKSDFFENNILSHTE